MIEKLKDWAIEVAGLAALATMEVSMRLRGKWRRSILRERLRGWLTW